MTLTPFKKHGIGVVILVPSRACQNVFHVASMHAFYIFEEQKILEACMEKFCKISMQPAKSSEQIHAHFKKYGCSLENV